VTNAGNNSISSVSISPTAGTVTNYPAFPAADCATPQGIAFDGANIWVGYGQGSHLPAAGVYKL
jgi:hypothetical protein